MMNAQLIGGYAPRLVDPLLDELMAGLPAVFVTGPRAVGKTTTAARRASSTVRLDDPRLAEVWSTSPDSLLARLSRPVLLDEWQYVPQVIGAVKRAVDEDPSPGQFIITGSAEADLAPAVWPGVGRLVRVPMWGLTRAELTGTTATFLDQLAAGGPWDVSVDSALPTLPEYVSMAVQGQYPAAMGLPDSVRIRWADSYLNDLVARDVTPVAGARDPVLLTAFLRACAELSATVTPVGTYLEISGTNRATAGTYERALTGLGVIDAVPAWHDHRLKRLTRMPKRLIVDTSLMTALLRVDFQTLLADARLLGRLLETFVIAQLRPEVGVSRAAAGLYHLRTEQGRHEVDLVVDLGRQRIAAIEVKATSAPRAGDAQHLTWLREEIGDRFVAGVLLHSGPSTFRISDRVWALPVATLWT